jgi:hypothetical protein
MIPIPSAEVERALMELLDGLWYEDNNPVLLEFETADEAVSAWHQREKEGTFFAEHPIRNVLILWQAFLDENIEALIREQF